MRKFKVILVGLIIFCVCTIMNVQAKEYTKEDVEVSLGKLLNAIGAKISYKSTETGLSITSEVDGKSYVTNLIYENGIFTFTSDLNEITTEEEFLRSTYEDVNLAFLLSAIAITYDDETIRGAADAVVGDLDNIDKFTLDSDGLLATVLPSKLSQVKLVDGSTLTSTGFIKTMSMNINHKNFIKLLTDNDGSIQIGASTKNPSGPKGPSTDVSVPDESKDNSTEDVKYSVNFDANGGKDAPSSVVTVGTCMNIPMSKPTQSGNNFLGWSTNPNAKEPDKNFGSGYEYCGEKGDITLYAVWQPQTGVNSPLVIFSIVGVIAAILFIIISKNNLFKQIR